MIPTIQKHLAIHMGSVTISSSWLATWLIEMIESHPSDWDEIPLLIGFIIPKFPYYHLVVVKSLLLADVQAHLRVKTWFYRETLTRRYDTPFLICAPTRGRSCALWTLFSLSDNWNLEDPWVLEAHKTNIPLGITQDSPLLIVAIMLVKNNELTLRFRVIGAVQTVVRVEDRDNLIDLRGVVEERQLIVSWALHY